MSPVGSRGEAVFWTRWRACFRAEAFGRRLPCSSVRRSKPGAIGLLERNAALPVEHAVLALAGRIEPERNEGGGRLGLGGPSARRNGRRGLGECAMGAGTGARLAATGALPRGYRSAALGRTPLSLPEFGIGAPGSLERRRARECSAGALPQEAFPPLR